MNPSSPSSQMRTLLLCGAVLVIAGAIAVRLLPTASRVASSPSVSAPAPTTVAPTTTTSAGVPEFTSASFETGDALTGLGPEWTVLRQDVPSGRDAKFPTGLSATRETLVKLVNASSTLLITELTIDNAKTLKKSLAVKAVTAKTIATRKGYLVPVPSLTGGSAFLLTGSSTALLLEYGIDPNGNLMNWPKDVPPEIQSYIATVKVY